MSALARRVRTLWRLGVGNLLKVAAYRFCIRAGIHPAQRVMASLSGGPFFSPVDNRGPLRRAPASWTAHGLLFGRHAIPVSDEPPDWHQNPLGSQADGTGQEKPWWSIPDFGDGDIKYVWEMSRFDWALAFAQQARRGGVRALKRLNAWLDAWISDNPPFLGRNWKCAQEASIRLIHISLASVFLEQDHKPSAAVLAFIEAHVRRIKPTLAYANAQNNNHATSEAAALFVAGAWLSLSGQTGAHALEESGRALLESNVARLFHPDGSFSQYSVNYHRLALDTLSVAEFWRRRAGLKDFSAQFYERASAASEWLRTIVDSSSGDAPNIGANDGANLLPLDDSDFRDFRNSVQLACILFQGANAYAPGPWDETLRWLDGERAVKNLVAPASANFGGGGTAVLRKGEIMGVLRYPRFRFRPSQADALHLDLWVGGVNVLRDGGSYSYNTTPDLLEYFGGVESHNTIQFDGAPQMPRISRFLLGDWLETQHLAFAPDRVVAAYRSERGWYHQREVQLGKDLVVIDTARDFAREALLRWRLHPGEWVLEGAVARCGQMRLEISADVPIFEIVMKQGLESRYYGEMTPVPVLEIKIQESGRLFSRFSW